MSIQADYVNNEAIFAFTGETTYTLPSFNSRDSITIKNLSYPSLTCTPAAGQTIDGASTLVVKGRTSAKLVRGESEWVVVASYEDKALDDYVVATQGAGTAYSLTNTAAKVDLGTTDPVIVLDKAGTYLVMAQIQLTYTGATVVAETASVKVRRSNNTAADASSVVVIDLPVSVTLTHTYGVVPIPPFVYTTANSDDSLEIFANVSAALGAGTIDATAVGTKITAIRLY